MHLVVAITMLVPVSPFGKWSHVVYRPLAMYFHAVRKNVLRRMKAGAAGPAIAGARQPQAAG